MRGARRLSLDEAVLRAQPVLYLPSYLPPALAGEEPQFWLFGRQAIVRYSSGSESGLAIRHRLWRTGWDPAEVYRRDARETNGARTVWVRGSPGFAIGWHAIDGHQPAMSFVQITFDRTEVDLDGRIPLEDLLRVAESLERVG